MRTRTMSNAQKSVRQDMKRADDAMVKALALSPALASKLASVIVHTEEMLSVKGHPFDKDALLTTLRDPEVSAWIKALGPLAPLKR